MRFSSVDCGFCVAGIQITSDIDLLLSKWFPVINFIIGAVSVSRKLHNNPKLHKTADFEPHINYFPPKIRCTKTLFLSVNEWFFAKTRFLPKFVVKTYGKFAQLLPAQAVDSDVEFVDDSRKKRW